MHNFFWKYKEINKDEVANIASEFSVPQSIASIMSLKSINNKQKSKDFFQQLANLENASQKIKTEALKRLRVDFGE